MIFDEYFLPNLVPNFIRESFGQIFHQIMIFGQKYHQTCSGKYSDLYLVNIFHQIMIFGQKYHQTSKIFKKII